MTEKSDAETQRLLGGLAADMKTVMGKVDAMEKKLDSVVAMTNRWKGATTILIFLGGLIGWVSNLFLKAVGKA